MTELAANPYDRNCPSRRLLDRIGDRWTVLIVGTLAGGPMRFGQIARHVDGVSQKMLTQTLRAMERDGLVRRTVYPVVPPKVEYALTDLGCSFGEPIRALGGWVFTHHDRIQLARAEFDRRNEVDTGNKLIKLG